MGAESYVLSSVGRTIPAANKIQTRLTDAPENKPFPVGEHLAQERQQTEKASYQIEAVVARSGTDSEENNDTNRGKGRSDTN
jgi:hypothetical protein